MRSDLPQGPDSPPTNELRSAELSLGVLHQVVRGIAEDDLGKQTPCEKFDVAGLTDHLLTSITVLGGAAGAEVPERDPSDSVERQVILAARPALDAWHRRGLDGAVDVGGREMPADVLVGILSLEFLVHAWDFGAATGRDVPAPDSLSEYVLGLTQKFLTPEGRVRAGFDDPVEVAEDAPPLQRLLAFTGRRAEV
ncbi:TIGR03086 family metal-binding protein [Mycolicibacterium baixiangningiae]|uniref:TIGR03086 family metal-binding protein n=1 Tax=Mycolicibacterium baixiangningiae TaxID=2761578 RepID=UPI0018D1C4E2|nr:TIGR03086 family metal-binding protein [Mycolicibacterium baixiangningiae]